MNIILRGQERFDCEHCLDPGEVSRDFQRQVLLHCMTASDRCVGILHMAEKHVIISRGAKIHNGSEIFLLIVVCEINESQEARH